MSLTKNDPIEKSIHTQFINEIYFYIGVSISILILIYTSIKIIKKCQKKERSIQLATPMIAVATIRRNSCTRQSLAPIRRSSLNVQFLMESRTRRLCQSRPSVMLDCKV
ncbi:unnamed protein product [Adineta ricciae]|uniref:Uncharacterized protein n=1 Tax=Adineta ricciae TaxID=249248 RepID=A0A814BXH5_ADIRI|nr:unnamed protein product [Adineta ricciae]